ncbi:hypothetical protein [Roseimaritima ulvae]|uniref:Uncharacterized protein n=1 Tax=Roseimaritima ulvae TaxID=980254 RepID=A0A5B9QIT1_9BACT|nr:hypothetical protein [Roseimaritima ulvae]QEG38938.1 hypothetical protein UC8_08980 [Roseimaritima ulvae]
MNKTYAGVSPRPGGKRPLTIAGVLGAVALIGYAFVQPQLDERYGWNLPSLTERQAEQHQPLEQHERSANSQPADTQTADQIVPRETSPQTDPASEGSDADQVAGDQHTLRYGLLRSIGPDRFLSPAGLQYLPGSQEGHRLAHLKRHTEDQPNRPGSHGVFDGGMATMLQVLDEAYLKAKQNASGVTTQQDQGRTIYTVSMGRRVGYVGGREGNRRRKPMARRVRLVLEGTRVITAYPL